MEHHVVQTRLLQRTLLDLEFLVQQRQFVVSTDELRAEDVALVDHLERIRTPSKHKTKEVASRWRAPSWTNLPKCVLQCLGVIGDTGLSIQAMSFAGLSAFHRAPRLLRNMALRAAP